MEHTQLTVELRPSTGTLARLTATLNNHLVLSLTYTTESPSEAWAVVCVPQPHAARAQHKLQRLIDVINVTADHMAARRCDSSGAGLVSGAGPR